MDNWIRLCYYRYFVVGGEDDDRDDSLKSKRHANFDLMRSKLAHREQWNYLYFNCHKNETI